MQKPTAANSQIDNSIYDQLGDQWYTAFDNPVAMLRAESRTKLPWILEKLRKHFSPSNAQKCLDIGCGAGFLSNQLAAEGYHVTGLDLSEASLAVAKKHDLSQKVQYVCGNAYQLPFADKSFDVVTVMDFLEHVEDPEKVIQEVFRVLKTDGLFFFHTFNRNWLAKFVIIDLVEMLVKNTPKNMHVIELFIKPEELSKMCAQNNLQVMEMIGIRPLFSTITAKSILTGIVPEKFAFTLTRSLKLSYMGYAVKKT